MFGGSSENRSLSLTGQNAQYAALCHGVVDVVAMGCQPVRISHEDHLALPLGTDRANQLPLEGIKWLGCLGPLQGPLVWADVRVQDLLLVQD